MHELGIMKSVLEIVLEYSEMNDVKKVNAINLTVGALSDIIPAYAQMFFQLIAEDTIAEKAKINIETIPARIRCRSCGKVIEMEINKYACNECESESIELISGREFRVASMEVE